MRWAMTLPTLHVRGIMSRQCTIFAPHGFSKTNVCHFMATLRPQSCIPPLSVAKSLSAWVAFCVEVRKVVTRILPNMHQGCAVRNNMASCGLRARTPQSQGPRLGLEHPMERFDIEANIQTILESCWDMSGAWGAYGRASRPKEEIVLKRES